MHYKQLYLEMSALDVGARCPLAICLQTAYTGMFISATFKGKLA